MSDLSTEIESFSAKRSSLRDKLKKRREAIGSILSQTTGAAASALSEDTKQAPKLPSPPPPVKPEIRKPTPEAEKISPVAVPTKIDNERVSQPSPISRHHSEAGKGGSGNARSKKSGSDDLMFLLNASSAKEKADQAKREEILELLGKPTAKERSLLESFKSSGGVQQFCTHSTKAECVKYSGKRDPCPKLHFAKIIQPHTDESLGDCSFLNTCFHMDTCKYIHYRVDPDDIRRTATLENSSSSLNQDRHRAGGYNPRLDDGDSFAKKARTEAVTSAATAAASKLIPPQWVQCDLRNFKLPVLGKFTVVMADPPWDIHMELPYGTMSDDEMRRLPVPTLQDEGLIFLWVTGRAMELGRECLKLWGYERVDEIIWVKTNQLQRIIRTGRTGHWLNHGKEHCLVGMKGNCPKLNRGLDSDVIVAEVRATSHKPDEIYGIIERLSPGTRKIELFGRPHNVQPNWVTLGNQLDGVLIHDEEMMGRWTKEYGNGGYNITEDIYLHPRQKP